MLDAVALGPGDHGVNVAGGGFGEVDVVVVQGCGVTLMWGVRGRCCAASERMRWLKGRGCWDAGYDSCESHVD